jgi:cation:H+ antiporter
MVFATGNLLYDIPLFALGLYMLVKGSDWFVDSASFIAKRFDVSEMVIGLTLVSIGTSLPELATNVYASFTKEGGVALGNAVGSNITNITLVLGLGGILYGEMPLPKSILGRDLGVLLFVYALFGFICMTGPGGGHELARWEGCLLLAVFAGYSWWLFKKGGVPSDAGEETSHCVVRTMGGAALFFILGLIMITCGAKLGVDTVVAAAESMRVPKEIISATVIAFGTSVPELAVTVAGLKKDKNDMALGNIVGSCVFNLVLVMGVAVAITPVPVSKDMLRSSIPLMLVSGVLLFVFAKNKKRLFRFESAMLLAVYLGFIGYNVWRVLD